MHQKYEKYFKKKTDFNLIYSNQEFIFEYYLGIKPNNHVRLKSPFRIDNSAGCRFEFRDGKWYFIDNAYYKGKLYFDCIAFVQYLLNIDTYINSALFILNNLELDYSKSEANLDFNYKSKILITPKKYIENGYFKNTLDIDNDHLLLNKCYLVDSYWANTKNNNSLRFNCVGNPKEEEIYAFYFENSKHVKLYFPNRAENKFFTNCNYDDYFGYNQTFDYSQPLIVTKSGKDQLLLSKYYPNVIGLQAETMKNIPNNLLTFFSKFNKIVIWFDNDYTGITNSTELVRKLIEIFPNKEIILNIHSEQLAKDPSDMYIKNQLNNYLKYEFNYKVRNKS